jgi:phage FluMu protein Com
MIAEPFEFDPYDPHCTNCGQALAKDHGVGQVRYEQQKCTMYQMLCPRCKTTVGFVIADQFDPSVPYVKVSLITNGESNK